MHDQSPQNEQRVVHEPVPVPDIFATTADQQPQASVDVPAPAAPSADSPLAVDSPRPVDGAARLPNRDNVSSEDNLRVLDQFPTTTCQEQAPPPPDGAVMDRPEVAREPSGARWPDSPTAPGHPQERAGIPGGAPTTADTETTTGVPPQYAGGHSRLSAPSSRDGEAGQGAGRDNSDTAEPGFSGEAGHSETGGTRPAETTVSPAPADGQATTTEPHQPPLTDHRPPPAPQMRASRRPGERQPTVVSETAATPHWSSEVPGNTPGVPPAVAGDAGTPTIPGQLPERARKEQHEFGGDPSPFLAHQPQEDAYSPIVDRPGSRRAQRQLERATRRPEHTARRVEARQQSREAKQDRAAKKQAAREDRRQRRDEKKRARQAARLQAAAEKQAAKDAARQTKEDERKARQAAKEVRAEEKRRQQEEARRRRDEKKRAEQAARRAANAQREAEKETARQRKADEQQARAEAKRQRAEERRAAREAAKQTRAETRERKRHERLDVRMDRQARRLQAKSRRDDQRAAKKRQRALAAEACRRQTAARAEQRQQVAVVRRAKRMGIVPSADELQSIRPDGSRYTWDIESGYMGGDAAETPEEDRVDYAALGLPEPIPGRGN